MSAFYDLASLVVVPSGYKSGKIYAQKPLTTDGQLTFSRASTATRVNASGLIETVSSNVPRLDYLGSTCPKLQLEPQRQNVLLNSENASVQPVAGTVTVSSNSSTSPDGNQTADTITADSSSYLRPTITTGVGTAMAWSLFLKNVNSAESILMVRTSNTAIQVNVAWTGAVPSATVVGGTGGVKVVDYGNDWYRFEINTTSADNTTYFRIYPSSGTSASVIFWGGQVELNASYSTSYVPTLGAAVTRLADACSKTGISSLIGQTEGTLFVDFVLNNYDASAFIPFVATNTAADQVYFLLEPNGQVYADFYFNSSFSARIATSTGFIVKGTRYKMALVYKENDFAFYINGEQIGTDNSGIVRSMASAHFVYPYAGGYGPSGNTINQALLFKSRLTNAQLAELTTL